jgi:plasmid stabilization system protein ParE
MKLSVKFRRQAKKELYEAVDWYEQKRLGLGSRFRSCVEEVLDRVSVAPEVHGLVHKDVRCGVVRGFPYAVYYRVIVVIAVLHGSRDPREWLERL